MIRKFVYLLIAACSFSQAHALEIRIDYTYDTSNFFDTQEKRDAIEAVADFYGEMIKDKLLRIDESDFGSSTWTAQFFHPATGSVQEFPGLVVPEDVIIVYVGARELGGSVAGVAGPGGWFGSGSSAWFDRIQGRGQAGAEPDDPALRTDYAPWGGSIAFDTPRNWNFSQSSNQTGTEFIRIALHEMGHVLGVGTADTWDNLLNGSFFTGDAAGNSYGSAPSADSGHFTGSLTSERYGSFGASHGASRPVLMLPSSFDDGVNFDVATDLDLAALVDIGWEVRPATDLKYTSLTPSGVSLNWNSVSFRTYQVRRSVDLATFDAASTVGEGNGLVQTWNDPSPPADRAFYRLLVADVIFPNPAQIQEQAAIGDDKILYMERAPKEVENCCIIEPSPER